VHSHFKFLDFWYVITNMSNVHTGIPGLALIVVPSLIHCQNLSGANGFILPLSSVNVLDISYFSAPRAV